MKNCPFCHSEIEDEAVFCPECGAKLTAPEAAAETVAETPEAAPAAPAFTEEPEAGSADDVFAAAAEDEPPVKKEKHAKKRPVPEEEPLQEEEPVPEGKGLLSTGAYMGLELLFCVPVIGLILLFVWGAGRPKNESLKRFSASILIWRLLFYVILLVLAILLVLFAGTLVPKIADAVKAFIAALGA